MCLHRRSGKCVKGKHGNCVYVYVCIYIIYVCVYVRVCVCVCVCVCRRCNAVTGGVSECSGMELRTTPAASFAGGMQAQL